MPLPPQRNDHSAQRRRNAPEALFSTGPLLARRLGLGWAQGVSAWVGEGGWPAGWSTGLRWVRRSASRARGERGLSRAPLLRLRAAAMWMAARVRGAAVEGAWTRGNRMQAPTAGSTPASPSADRVRGR